MRPEICEMMAYVIRVSKNSEIPKIKSIRGPKQNNQHLIFIRLADFCALTEQSQILDTSSNRYEKRNYWISLNGFINRKSFWKLTVKSYKSLLKPICDSHKYTVFFLTSVLLVSSSSRKFTMALTSTIRCHHSSKPKLNPTQAYDACKWQY